MVGVTAHLGAPLLPRMFLEARRIRTLLLVSGHHRPETEDTPFSPIRDLPHSEVVYVGDAMRRCVRGLRGDIQLVLAAGDRILGERGVDVQMFGRRILLPAGPALIAMRTGAAIIPTFTARVPGGFEIRFCEPILPPMRGSVREKVRYMVERFARDLEAIVRRYPGQWHLFYKVFDPPEGGPDDPLRRMKRNTETNG